MIMLPPDSSFCFTVYLKKYTAIYILKFNLFKLNSVEGKGKGVFSLEDVASLSYRLEM